MEKMMSRRMVFGRYDYAAFLSFAGYACCSVVVPLVLTRMAADLGFPLEEGNKGAGGALQLGRSIPMVLAMLVCGFAAGRWGKYLTLGISLLLMGTGILLVSGAPWYYVVFAAVTLAGVGEGVMEGLATPFVQDQHPDEPGRYINFTHSFWSVGVLGMVVVAGAGLYFGVSWRAVVALAGAVTFIPALLLLLPDRRPGARPGHDERRRIALVWRQAVAIMRIPRFWLFFVAMFLAGGGEFCLTFWVASYLKLDFHSGEIAAAAAVASFAAAMIVGRMGTGILVRQHHLKQLVVVCAVIGTLVSALIPSVYLLEGRMLTLTVLLALLFLCGLATAPFWPSIQSYCSDRMPEADTTMVFILLSCAGVPGCGVFAWLMGVVGDWYSLNTAFYLVPVCYAALGVLIAAQWAAERREAVAE